jgi:hypothetical protein
MMFWWTRISGRMHPVKGLADPRQSMDWKSTWSRQVIESTIRELTPAEENDRLDTLAAMYPAPKIAPEA